MSYRYSKEEWKTRMAEAAQERRDEQIAYAEDMDNWSELREEEETFWKLSRDNKNKVRENAKVGTETPDLPLQRAISYNIYCAKLL